MKKALVLIISTLLLASCGGQTRSGVTSALLLTSWSDTISGVSDNSVTVEKKGEACATNILGIVASGDSSIETAKRNAGIKKVAYADTTYFNVLGGLYQKGCTVAKGQ